MGSDRSRGRKASPHKWQLRDLEAEEVDRSMGVETPRERRRRIRNHDGGEVDDGRRLEIAREGYLAGWSMSVPSWECPFKSGTWQAKAWREGWGNGWRERAERDRGDEQR